MKEELSATNQGLAMIGARERACVELSDAKRRLSQAETALANFELQIAAWLVPKDAKIGERFALAVGEAFFEVTIEAQEVVELPTDGPGGAGVHKLEPRPRMGWRNDKRPKDVHGLLGRFA